MASRSAPGFSGSSSPNALIRPHFSARFSRFSCPASAPPARALCVGWRKQSAESLAPSLLQSLIVVSSRWVAHRPPKTAMAHHHEIAQLLLESGAVWASGLNVPWFLAGAGLGAPAAVGAVSTGNSKLLSLVSGDVRCSCLRSTRVRRKQQITRRLFSLAPESMMLE